MQAASHCIAPSRPSFLPHPQARPIRSRARTVRAMATGNFHSLSAKTVDGELWWCGIKYGEFVRMWLPFSEWKHRQPSQPLATATPQVLYLCDCKSLGYPALGLLALGGTSAVQGLQCRLFTQVAVISADTSPRNRSKHRALSASYMHSR